MIGMTSFGDLLGPQPVLLPEDSDAEGALLDKADPVQVAADHPAASIAWLANKLAEFGLALEAGMKVMSGSFTRQYLLNAGDRIDATFTPVGSVRAEFI